MCLIRERNRQTQQSQHNGTQKRSEQSDCCDAESIGSREARMKQERNGALRKLSGINCRSREGWKFRRHEILKSSG